MASKRISRILSGAAVVFCVILLCTMSVKGQQFGIRKLTFTISGSVGLSGVRMTGLPNSPITDNNGFYTDNVDYNWSGKVTPEKEGYTFDPPSIPYTNVKSSLENQNYTAQIKKFTISGSVGEAGVTMVGLPDSPVSGSDGTYKATIEFGGVVTVTPTKEGLTFNPISKQYSQVNKDYTGENYIPAPITFEISGSVGQSGVVLKGLPGDPISGTNGAYKAVVRYGWNDTVTPQKEGLNFNPPDRQYSNVISSQTYQDYTAEEITYTISGSAGAPGVVMKGLPNDPVSTAEGTYLVTVKYGFTGKVTPEKPGFTFKPLYMTYSKVVADFRNQDYTPEEIKFTISGSVGREGVIIKGLPGDPTSGPGGVYQVTVPFAWNGTVIPEKEGLIFTPDKKTYPSVTSNQMNQNYNAAPITFTISGSAGAAGVLIKGLPGRIISGESGFYTANVEFGWNGMVTPEKAGYAFNPPVRSYSRIITAEGNQDYTASLEKRSITGKIISAKGPVHGASIFADGTGGPVVTNANGEYSLSVDYGWSGTVTPNSEGYTFRPADKKYPPITQDQGSQDFAAEVVMLTISGSLPMPIESVVMSVSEGGIPGTTDSKGHYIVKVPYGWNGEITPKKEGFAFDPPSNKYTNVTTNYVDGQPVPRETPERKVLPQPSAPSGPTKAAPTTTGPSAPSAISTLEQLPAKGETHGPILEVPSDQGKVLGPEFDEQTKLLENQIGSLQQQVEGLLHQLSPGQQAPAELTEPNVLTKAGQGITGTVKPGASGTVPSKVPSVSAEVPRARGGPLVSGNYIDTDLRVVLQDLAEQSGINIYADDTVKGKVTCRLIREHLEGALDEVLKGTGYIFKEIPHSYLVFKPISNTFADTEMRDVLQALSTASGMVIVADETVSGLVTANIVNQPLDTVLDIVLAGTPYYVKKTPNYYLVASGAVDSRAFASVSETQRVKMNYTPADTAIGLLSIAFRPYVQAETHTHTVLVTAPAALVNRIVSDLKQIDIPPRHVMLEAKIVVMERSDLLNLGVEWGWPKISAGTFSSDFRGGGTAGTPQFGGDWPWGVQIGYTPDAVFTDSLLLTLNLLAQNGQANIVSSPQVLAQDGRQSMLSVMNEEYYYLTAPVQTAGFYTESQMETITAGTRLTITPRIGDNNDITLEIAADVSDVVSRGEATQRTVPLVTVSRRNATNTVRIKDGGTVAVAGLTENKTVKEESRVPGLGNVPVLGNLFKNKRSQGRSQEMAVFVTARLVPDVQGLVELPESQSLEGTSAKPMSDDDFKMRLRQSLMRPSR